MNKMICIGHRGACGYRPENTLSSFSLAIEQGCPWVELDVYAVQGELLVIHDDSLERTTNGKGNVMDASVEYLRSLDAGDGQQIPTLQEVIALVDMRCGVNVELKGPDTAHAVSDYLNKLCDTGASDSAWQTQHFLLSSFNHKELALADPKFNRGALFHKPFKDYFKRTSDLDAYSINLSLKLVSQKLVDKAHQLGLKVFVYTVNDEQDILKLSQMGVDGVFCDYPDRVNAALARQS